MGESIQSYYLRYAKLINDMNIIGISMTRLQINMKFVNHIQTEYSSQKSQYKQQLSKLPQNQPIIPPPQQQSYELPVVQQQSPALSTQLDLGFIVPSFLPTEDPIANLNKAMMFLSTAINSRFPLTNNQLRTLFNLRTQATIQDGKVTVQNEEQTEFLADGLEEFDLDYDDLQLNTTSIFKADHADGFDSNCDEEATPTTIFMVRLSPAGSVNGDNVGPTYDSNIHSKGMKHIKDAYEAEVIPFVKNLRESFKLFEMGLYKEKKEEKEIGSLKTRLSKLVIKDSREKKEVLERERILKPVCKEVQILSRNSELFIGKEE
ncbi:hypothetical protein Tco_0371047 [Tanacetum coccineum]